MSIELVCVMGAALVLMLPPTLLMWAVVRGVNRP